MYIYKVSQSWQDVISQYQVKRIEGMRGPMKCYKNNDNCLLAFSSQFNFGILRFISSASSISN